MSAEHEGYISIRKAARLAHLRPREMRKRLKYLHRRHKGVLFKFSDARNAKLWTTPEALERVMKEKFGDVTQGDVIDLRSRMMAIETRQDRTERRVDRIEKRRA